MTAVKNVQATQEVTLNYEEMGRENQRNKKLNAESEISINKIKDIVGDLKRVREEIELLKEDLEQRQDKILYSLKKTIYSQVAEILPENTGRKVVYDDDDMVTASPASSMSE